MTAEPADFVLIGAGHLVTCQPGLGRGPLGVIEQGALAGRSGKVVWAGPERDLRRSVEVAPGAVEVDAAGAAVLPGLVDCHTHLVFAGDRSDELAARLSCRPYSAGGVLATVRATRAASDQDLRALARARLDRFLSFGVTTIEAKSGYGLTAEHEIRLVEIAATLDHPVEVVPTLLGAHVVPEEHADDPDRYVGEVIEAMVPGAAGRAAFCDVWCDAGAFAPEQARRVLEAGRRRGLVPKVHAEQLGHTGGAALAASVRAVSADHLEHATEEDAAALASAGTMAVLLPGASMTTGGPFAPARMLIQRGVRVALSTDFNPGTSYSENLQLVVALACLHLGMSVEEAILGVTRHAAAAIGLEGRCGSLAPGSACDLVVLDARSEVDLAYHYGVNLAASVTKRGGRAGL